jgi:hypothetical protein
MLTLFGSELHDVCLKEFWQLNNQHQESAFYHLCTYSNIGHVLTIALK